MATRSTNTSGSDTTNNAPKSGRLADLAMFSRSATPRNSNTVSSSDRLGATARSATTCSGLAPGLYSTATWRNPGTISLSNSSRLPTVSSGTKVSPVTLPPGCDRLFTSPALTMSALEASTIGMVLVACAQASAGTLPEVTMTSQPVATISVANSRNLPAWPSPQRVSIVRFLPSVQPSCDSRAANAVARWPPAAGVFDPRNPILRTAPCAPATSGHAAAAPPRSRMNARRCMASPPRVLPIGNPAGNAAGGKGAGG